MLAQRETILGEVAAQREEIEGAFRKYQSEMVAVLNRKAYMVDVHRSLTDKASKESVDEIVKGIRSKADAEEVRENIQNARRETGNKLRETRELIMDLRSAFARFREETAATLRELPQKADREDLHKLRLTSAGGDRWQESIADLALNLRKELGAKASSEDVRALVRTEADDLQQQLEQLSSEVDGRATVAVLRHLEAQTSALTRRVQCELSTARWIWKTGHTGPGGVVPWNIQIVNTDPDSYLWRRDESTVTTVVPGLDHVCIGFFTNRNPAVQFRVNGEPVLALDPIAGSNAAGSAAPQAAAATNAGQSHVLRRGRHSAGNVTGISLSEFVALPANAVLSITYDCAEGAQGFLGIRKL
jgi:hypothetical protein